LENEKSLINNRLENDKAEFERKLKEAEYEREDLLNKNRVKSNHFFLLTISFIGYFHSLGK
jgi:hypothetical protein